MTALLPELVIKGAGMTNIAIKPKRRSRWGLFAAPVLLLIAAIAWSGFWLFAASQVGVQADAWRAHEARAAATMIAPNARSRAFRSGSKLPVMARARPWLADGAGNNQFTAKLDRILVVAQVYDPKHVIAEFSGPAAITDKSGQNFAANWKLGRASVFGLPDVPQRASIVFDAPTLASVDGSMQVPLAEAGHIELHGRLAEGSPKDAPVIESVVQINKGTIRGLHPLLAEPFDADMRALVSGLKDLSPKPWPVRFRELQAAGGHVEITQSRIQQGDLIAVAAGTLGLSPAGRLEGELQMTVTGLERVIPALGIDKMLDEGVPQATLDKVAPGVKTQDLNNLFGALDRAIPGLGKVVKQNANVGVAAGINALGKEAELEGKKARAFPLRFVDGAVFLGPLKVAQTPPLF